MIQGLIKRRISRRLAEVDINGIIFEAYISNGIDMKFLKNGETCFLREAENETRRTPFDLYSVYRNRYGCIVNPYEYGYDDAAADYDFHAV